MGKVSAKVILGSKIQYAWGTQEREGDYLLSFHADYADGRNKEWAAASPSLSIQMTVRPDVAKLFDQGERYTLYFEKEEPETPAEDSSETSGETEEVPDGGDSSS